MLSSSKISTILDKNSELYVPTPLVAFDQSRLIVNLDQNIIDDIDNQIETKQKILDNDPVFSTVSDLFVNVIDVFYGLMKWIINPLSVNLFDIIFTGYRPVSIVVFGVLCYYIITWIYYLIQSNFDSNKKLI